MDTTQTIGVAAFAAAALLCARAGVRSSAVRPLWWAMAAGYLLMAVDVVAEQRYAAVQAVANVVRAWGEYDGRRSVQPFLIAGFALLLLACMAWLTRRLGRRRAERLGLLGFAAALFLFGIEMISLHAVDAVLYHRIGPLVAIAVPWVAAAAVSCVAALAAARS